MTPHKTQKYKSVKWQVLHPGVRVVLMSHFQPMPVCKTEHGPKLKVMQTFKIPEWKSGQFI